MVLFDGCCDDVRDVDIVVIYFKNDVFIVWIEYVIVYFFRVVGI